MRTSITLRPIDRLRSCRASKSGISVRRLILTTLAVIVVANVARIVLRTVMPAMIDRCCGSMADERCDEMRARCARVFGGSAEHWRVSTAA